MLFFLHIASKSGGYYSKEKIVIQPLLNLIPVNLRDIRGIPGCPCISMYKNDLIFWI